MDLLDIYHPSVPDFVRAVAATAPMQRLRDVGMNCGCEYSSVATYRTTEPYSRFGHSLGAGLIVWHFTGDVRQSVSALLHDVATPCFAHSIDFLHGDYVSQESTEDRTLEIIAGAPDLVSVLSELGLTPSDVCDYHLFPIADNDTPRLSSDRLEYTLGNGVNFGFISKTEASQIYASIVAGRGPDGDEELVFTDSSAAVKFAFTSLRCSRIYSSDENRYLMQRVAEIVRDCCLRGVIAEDDLYGTEPALLSRVLSDPASRDAWLHYRSIAAVRVLGPATCASGSGTPDANSLVRVIGAKKRHINPYIIGVGRVTDFSPAYRDALADYLSTSFDLLLSE